MTVHVNGYLIQARKQMNKFLDLKQTFSWACCLWVHCTERYLIEKGFAYAIVCVIEERGKERDRARGVCFISLKFQPSEIILGGDEAFQ